MQNDSDLAFLSIEELGARLRDWRLSPVALARLCLDRIAAFDPTLNAFITVTADVALEQARAAERELKLGRWRGAMHGVPVAVKDFYDTAGVPTTAASAQYRNRIPARDAAMVARLREAGAVLVGKTNMHRLGSGTTSLESDFGPVVNPHDPTLVAGGSSGGSAVAVATGCCFATVDTDAVGSGRLPAAICGVSCFKPTFGVLSSAGVLEGEPTDPTILLLGHPCVTARSAADVTAAFEALAPSPFTEATAQTPSNDATLVRRLGVVTNYRASAEVRKAFESAVGVLTRLVSEVVEVLVPFDAASFDVDRIRRDRERGSGWLFAGADALALPTLTAPAPTVDAARAQGEMAVSPDNTFFCNYYGLPAISIPIGADTPASRLGLQLVGPLGSDRALLALAAAYQRVSAWRYTRPRLA